MDADDIDDVFADPEFSEWLGGVVQDATHEVEAKKRYADQTRYQYVYPARLDNPDAGKGSLSGEVRDDEGGIIRRMTAEEIRDLLDRIESEERGLSE